MNAPDQTTTPAAATWHAEDPDRVLERLQTSRDGLSAAEAKNRLEQYGRNVLARAGGNRALTILLRQLRDPLIYVLLGSTVLAILTGKIVDGSVIAGVVVLNAIIGFVQEYRANRAIEALATMVPTETVVWRAGERRSVPAAELVPGDVVQLAAGDRVPADLRLLQTRSLTIEEAALTGESTPVGKVAEPVAADADLADRTSMAFNGTLVRQGTTTAVVVATGAATELGRISTMLGEATDLETPLTRQLAKVARWIAWAVVAVALLLLGIGLWRGYALGDAILAAVTLAVAAIPEGLPAIVTIALAIGVQRMARRNAIIRRLPAVETLGATTVICSDKTGTLSRNEMTAQLLATDAQRYRLTGVGYAPEGALTDGDGGEVEDVPAAVEALLRAAALCNDAALRQGDDGTWELAGDPTEGALVVAAEKLGLANDALRRSWPRVAAIPFESERQFMATRHSGPEGDVVFLKGAPEVVFRRCDGVDVNARITEVEEIAARGMRVLAVAAKDDVAGTDLDEEQVASGFALLGLVGMIDPPREEAIDAVALCRRAGIEVKMITGDHRVTAQAIGRELALGHSDAPALAGRDLDQRSEDELRELAKSHGVFARVAPEHKLALVKALQADRQVVAMTGDGVNDAPALKQADIGVAMGITGTAASKEAADMVLADDNFASIAAAVQEGRRVYDNLIKALAFVLPTNLGLALIMIAAVVAFPIVDGRPLLPMAPVQVLWINLVAAVALALPLAFEAMEPDLMQRPPRRPDAALLDRFVIGRTVLVAALMTAGALTLFALRGAGPEELATAQTQAVTTVILFQIIYLLDCRSLTVPFVRLGVVSNPWIIAGIATVLTLQLLFVYAPFMHVVFGAAPLSARDWLEALAVAVLIAPVIAAEKWWRRRGGASGSLAPATPSASDPARG